MTNKPFPQCSSTRMDQLVPKKTLRPLSPYCEHSYCETNRAALEILCTCTSPDQSKAFGRVQQVQKKARRRVRGRSCLFHVDHNQTVGNSLRRSNRRASRNN